MFRLAPLVLLAASLSSVAVAQDTDLAAAPKNPPEVAEPKPVPFAGCAYLELSLNDKFLHAFVHGAEPGFVGVVGLSLTPNVAQPFTGLPPFLVDAVVVAYGFTKTQDLELSVPLGWMPAEAIQVYGQAILFGEEGIGASGIVPLTIGPAKDTEPAKDSPINLNRASLPIAR